MRRNARTRSLARLKDYFKTKSRITFKQWLGDPFGTEWWLLHEANGYAMGSGVCKDRYQNQVDKGNIVYQDNGRFYRVKLTTQGRKLFKEYEDKEEIYLREVWPELISQD